MKMSVTVKKFEKEDVGSYRCIAKNSLGEVDSSIRLYGEFPPNPNYSVSSCKSNHNRCSSPEIPGPTRKVSPPKHSGSDTNEISVAKSNKSPLNGGKESHLPSAKNSYQNPEYEEIYSSSEDDEFDSSLGELI